MTLIIDTIFPSMKYPENWTIPIEKGYQGTQQQAKAVIPKKKPHGKNFQLTGEDKSWNAKGTINCIFVENYFCLLTKRWGSITSKHRRAEEEYDNITPYVWH